MTIPGGSIARSSEPAFSKTTVVYKKIGSLPIKADVYRPDDSVARPVILWIHGGALIGGGRNRIPKEQPQSYIYARVAVVSLAFLLGPEKKIPPHILYPQ